jgi:hypothetical protein
MANPNVVNVQLIRGKTSVRNYVKMASRFLLRNNSSSNEVLKVNSIIATSRSTRHENVSISYVTTTGTFNLISDFNIPPNSSVNLLQKETSIYLEEDTSLNVFSRSSNDSISVVCSYEQIASTIVSDRSDNYDNDTIEPLPSIGNESIVTSNLVMSFDAANSSSYIANGTAWIDMSNSRYVGRLLNGASYNTANNGVIIFDGVNDHVTLSNTVSTVIGSTLPATWEVWVYMSTSVNNEAFIGTSWNNGGMHMRKTGTSHPPADRLRFIYSTNSSSGTGLDSASTFTTGWYHFVVTYNGSGLVHSNFALFVNGSSVSVTNITFGTPTTVAVNQVFSIGALAAENTAYLNGRIPVVRAYNRVLSLAEIQQNFNALRSRYGL